MSSVKQCVTAFACSAALFLAGCGGGADVKTSTTTVSLGQQLIDLKHAHDKGSISDKEYSKLREDLIDHAK